MPDDFRARLLAALKPWPRSVTEIAALVGARPAAVSRALSELDDEGAVARTKLGHYRLPKPDA